MSAMINSCASSVTFGTLKKSNSKGSLNSFYSVSSGYGSASSLNSQASDYKYFTFKDTDSLSRTETKVKEQMKDYIDFLSKPNKNLVEESRKGQPGVPSEKRSVCPFIPGALKRNTIFLTVDPSSNPDINTVAQKLQKLKADFFNFIPKDGKDALYKTAIVTFPRLPLSKAPDVIDVVQRKTKKDFVKDGLMIGEFHELNDTSGLYNPEFKPLQTPVPALAIRYMVDGDLLFLKDPKYTPEERVTFLKAFINNNRNFKKNIEPAKEALQKAEDELKKQQSSFGKILGFFFNK